jgi:hypothetical protein
MRILHRVSKNMDGAMQRELHRLGVEVGQGLSTFVIDESYASWPEIRELIARWQCLDIVSTEFTLSECADAENLKMGPTWHHGYPQPEGDFGYLKKTYDLGTYCETCGIGKRQCAPFRMKREPNWGKRQILQLNWVFDEFFVLPEVWSEVFRPMQILSAPVLEHKTGKELRTVVQLEIKDVASSSLSLEGKYGSETCEVCGRKKYFPITRGCFPPFTNGPSSRICRTQESFGSGTSAWNGVMVNNEVYNAIHTQKLSGVSFTPLCES